MVPEPQGGTGPSAAFESEHAIIVRELGLDADGIRMIVEQLGSQERVALGDVSTTVEALVARAQELGDELLALDAEMFGRTRGAGSAAIAAPTDRVKEDRRTSLMAKIGEAASAVMSLRLKLLQAMRPDVTDGMASVRESAARVAPMLRPTVLLVAQTCGIAHNGLT